jgi:tetratricopeptide (TPR) repeat protein
MPQKRTQQPRLIPPVMVSSTFTDLQAHRAALIDALHSHGLFPHVMENDSARLRDVVESSLGKVRESAAYIGVISRKYGQIPPCAERNPGTLSLTELEFNEAQRLGLPALLFIMGRLHPLTEDDVESDQDKKTKLNAFRERAKQISSDSAVHRVYAEFNSLDEFKKQLGSSLAELKAHLESQQERDLGATSGAGSGALFEMPLADGLPKPPAFHAQPPYLGSHRFVGRAAQLQDLSDWAQPADPTQVLLFEAIGGNGKSMLTWEWTTNHAVAARPADSPWAGRFWYSFYERGARMADFCQHALAYITAQPLEAFEKRTTAELKDPLLAALRARPWLLVLDGLERVLVAYHRIDAAELPDEVANDPTDAIAKRDPCDAIREEDNDLLRAFVAAAPSKLLVSSRLTPRVLLNPSGQPIPGAKRITLPGLRPPDAEALLRSCGIRGESAAIQHYLTTNCDNHPLVIGALAGLIANHLPDRGNFHAWVADPEAGGGLDLASLGLIQRRNHILRSAIAALSSPSRELLHILSLLNEAVDYAILSALNPHLPPEPEKEDPAAKQARMASAEFRDAPKQLQRTVIDLEKRGLLQVDGRERAYGLHPVVRAVAAGGMAAADLERHGLRVVDVFNAQPTRPYDEAETLEDVRVGLQVVRTLLKLGRFEEAADVYLDGLNLALLFNLEAYPDILVLLRGFFPEGWNLFPAGVDHDIHLFLVSDADRVLRILGEYEESLKISDLAIQLVLRNRTLFNRTLHLLGYAFNFANKQVTLNKIAMHIRLLALVLELINLLNSDDDCDPELNGREFVIKLAFFFSQSIIGNWEEAASIWCVVDPMGRDWPRHSYRQGVAEYFSAIHRFWRGTLQEFHLAEAERLAVEGKNRSVIRDVHRLRGEWRLEQGEWALAASSFQEAVQLARERSLTDAESETGLALARLHLEQAADPQAAAALAAARQDAERLAQWRRPAHYFLALLWRALGDTEQAKHHALAAYRWAWADGEPYVRRYELTKATELLQQLNVPLPNLLPYDPAKEEPFAWEADVHALLASIRAEQEQLVEREQSNQNSAESPPAEP